MNANYSYDLTQLALEIKQIGKELGFSQIGITDTNLKPEFMHLKKWLELDYNGNMNHFKKYGDLFEYPEKISPEATSIICCRLNYPKSQNPNHPIASFAQIQDYSPYICELLQTYANKISQKTQKEQKTRVFSGNVPLLEKALGVKAGLGWYGKNSLVISEDSGSFFYFGEILIDLPLPIDQPIANKCGDCSKCIASCPTKAIINPHQIDAKKCISYLTGVYKGSIPLELRPLIGTKIFGCDLCQQVCPWNIHLQIDLKTPFTKFTHFATENLIDWFKWSEKEFQEKTKNSPISRIKHECWLRNIAIALGNSPRSTKILDALETNRDHPSELVREHVEWAYKKM